MGPSVGSYFRWVVCTDFEAIAKLSRWEDAVMVARANNAAKIKDSESGKVYVRCTVVEYVCREEE